MPSKAPAKKPAAKAPAKPPAAGKPAAASKAPAPAKPSAAGKPAAPAAPGKGPKMAKAPAAKPTGLSAMAPAAKGDDGEPLRMEKLAEGTLCQIEILKDGHFFIARTQTESGLAKEYKNTVFEDLLTEMLITLQEQLAD